MTLTVETLAAMLESAYKLAQVRLEVEDYGVGDFWAKFAGVLLPQLGPEPCIHKEGLGGNQRECTPRSYASLRHVVEAYVSDTPLVVGGDSPRAIVLAAIDRLPQLGAGAPPSQTP